MAYRIISSTGSAGSGSSGLPAGSGATPGNVLTLTCSGFTDPISGVITLSVAVTPPSPLGTFGGCHLWLELPDQSASAAQVVGSTAVGGTAAVTGPWVPYDLGQQPYVSSQQPWTIVWPGLPNLDFTIDYQARLYAVSYSNVWDNPPVQANQSGASPNIPFTLVSLASGTPTAGTSVTQTSGPIVATVLANDNTTGKLKTPVEVMVTSVPTNIKGWCYQFVLTSATADPTVKANQTVVSPLYTDAGLILTSSDGISVQHTFALDTPPTMTKVIVWLQAGLVDAAGNFTGNPIVPGVTPSWPFTYGSTTGVIDARQVLTDSIEASMSVASGLFGVAPAGITNPLLGSGAVATINVQALAVTNPLLASLCVQAANMSANSVTSTAIAAAAVGTAAIATAAITNALIANLAVSGAQIQNATILGANIANATIAGANIASATIGQANMASASIGTAQIQSGSITSAHISSCNISTLVAGTASFTGTATFQSGSGGQLILSGSGISMNNGSYGITIDSSGTITCSNFWGNTTVIGDLTGLGAVGRGIKTSTLLASGITITLGTIDFPTGVTATSGTAGSASALPSAPDGYLKITVNGVTKKIAYYQN